MDQVSLKNDIRREQTSNGLDHLSGEIDKWLRLRRDGDVDGEGQYVGRHETQLKAIGDTLQGATAQLSQSLRALDSTSTDGGFYDQCRDHDRSLVWLERLWEYF